MAYNDKNVIAKFSTKNYVILQSFLVGLGAALGDYCRLVIEPHPEGALLAENNKNDEFNNDLSLFKTLGVFDNVEG